MQVLFWIMNFVNQACFLLIKTQYYRNIVKYFFSEHLLHIQAIVSLATIHQSCDVIISLISPEFKSCVIENAGRMLP